MSKKKEKIDLNNLAPEEELKYEIAKELGLLDKVMEQGWKALTAKETGRIGGLMTRRRREEIGEKAHPRAALHHLDAPTGGVAQAQHDPAPHNDDRAAALRGKTRVLLRSRLKIPISNRYDFICSKAQIVLFRNFHIML